MKADRRTNIPPNSDNEGHKHKTEGSSPSPTAMKAACSSMLSLIHMSQVISVMKAGGLWLRHPSAPSTPLALSSVREELFVLKGFVRVQSLACKSPDPSRMHWSLGSACSFVSWFRLQLRLLVPRASTSSPTRSPNSVLAVGSSRRDQMSRLGFSPATSSRTSAASGFARSVSVSVSDFPFLCDRKFGYLDRDTKQPPFGRLGLRFLLLLFPYDLSATAMKVVGSDTISDCYTILLSEPWQEEAQDELLTEIEAQTPCGLLKLASHGNSKT
ncbi:hypothetical protein M5K25_012639 [Dendrobium thyrsiflorum]|uniref:Uncharacterized protein n=1 Tax=Dendrobium thyrsiflorum TaxID=117978 RepID=A0ABD0UY18_DENTH